MIDILISGREVAMQIAAYLRDQSIALDIVNLDIIHNTYPWKFPGGEYSNPK